MRKNLILQLITIALLSLWVIKVNGQSILPQVTPHSPNAASIGKYGDIPTTLSNGRINVEVPLLSLKIGSFELPISLTYHNNGLKVDEIPSWVGHGWDLSVPGCVNYNQRGLRDFSATGIFSSESKESLAKYLNNEMSPLHQAVYFEQLMSGLRDGEYDMYNYNFLGRSGSFYLNKNENVVPFPKNDLKIYRSDLFYQITDERGNIYSFDTKEYSQTIPDGQLGNENPINEFDYYSTFYISGITTSDNRDITFEYDTYSMSYAKQNKRITVNAFPNQNPNCPAYDFLSGGTTTFINEVKLLRAIKYEDVKVEFVHSTTYRNDLKTLNTSINVPYLSKIILSKNNVPITEVILSHSYFGYNSRLRLDSVSIKGNNSSAANSNVWRFNYYDDGTAFPNFFTTSKDHWGYYNGMGGVTSVPKANNYPAVIWHWPQTNESLLTNRTSDFSKSKLGLLNRIIYPTGGATEFVYEPNQFKFDSDDYIVTSNPFLMAPPAFDQILTPIIDRNTNDDGYIQESFTLTAATIVKIKAERAYEPLNLIESYVTLANALGTGNNLLYQLPFNVSYGVETREGTISLPPGTYYYTLKRGDDDWATTGFATLNISSTADIPKTNVPYIVGGGRISRLNNYLNGQLVGIKKFAYNDRLKDLVFTNNPYYLNKQERGTVYDGINGGVCGSCGVYSFLSDESLVPMIGDPLQYIYVSEFNDENGVEGKTEYKFSTSEILQDQYGYPYVQPIVSTWRSGKPLQTKVFKKNGANFQLIQQADQEFTYNYPYDSLTKGLKVDFFYQCSVPATALNPLNNGSSTYSPIVVNFQTEKFYPSGATSKYFANNDSLVGLTTYKNESVRHVERTEESSINSKGNKIIEKTKYTFDFQTGTVANDSATVGLIASINKNSLLPVEKVAIEEKNGVKYVTGAVLYTFNSRGLYAKRYRLKLATPILETAFNPATIQAGTFIKDSRYEEVEALLKYDAFNNLLESRSSDGVVSCYLWGYNSLYPVAKITGSNYATVSNIVTQAQIDAATSIAGNEANVRSLLNGLRTAFANDKTVQVSSYTYIPLVGVTSETDPTGRAIYYEYDNFNRLKLQKDEQGNILKKYCYNYAGQPIDCQ
jgi:YD repeat-containing protein